MPLAQGIAIPLPIPHLSRDLPGPRAPGASDVWAEPLLRFQHKPSVSVIGLDQWSGQTRQVVQKAGRWTVIEPQPFGRSTRRQSGQLRDVPVPRLESHRGDRSAREGTPQTLGTIWSGVALQELSEQEDTLGEEFSASV